MKKISKTLATSFAFTVFILLNWATSKDVNYIELDAEVSIIQDSLLVLDNMDAINITNAGLTLRNNQNADASGYYQIIEYNLAAFSSDTIAIAAFKNNGNQSYPSNIPPTKFLLSFEVMGQDGFVDFLAEL